ncbi:MAG: hypothetical protein U5N53_34325 [Mycobacterium sp.]|nr:hypothetical protein [Mycobacterium sp.]
MNNSARSAHPADNVRRPAEPGPDLSGITLTHRAMVTDTRRLAELTTVRRPAPAAVRSPARQGGGPLRRADV